MLAQPKDILLGLLVETALYAAYLSLFCLFIWTVTYKRAPHVLLSVAATLNFSLCTTYFALDLRTFSSQFAVSEDGSLGIYTSRLFGSSKTSFAMLCTLLINLFVADLVLMWRCLVIWNRDIRISIFTLILLLSTTTASLGSILSLNHNSHTTWGEASLVSAIVTNSTCTILIASKIWWHQRLVNGSADGGRRYIRRALTLVIESGAVTTLTLVTVLATFSNKPPNQIAPRVLSQITGIVPTSIIVLASIRPRKDTDSDRNRNGPSWPTQSSPVQSYTDGRPAIDTELDQIISLWWQEPQPQSQPRLHSVIQSSAS